MSFENFGLSAPILRALQKRGYKTPTAIQTRAIPPILKRRDILGMAQTGTGKTASFMLPILHRVSENKEKKGKPRPTALILTPTRELAAQVQECIEVYGKYLNVNSATVFGGVGIWPQKIKLRKGVDIIVATPGRLLDHVKQKTVDLSSIETLVLDEADCMLDMGFIHDIKRIIDLLPKERQNLLFSATFSESIRKLAKTLLRDPEVIEVAKQSAVSDQVKQVVYRVDRKRKPELLSHLIKSNDWQQVLVFTRTKRAADALTRTLKDSGIKATAIHGDKRQSARAKALGNFKKGFARVLVATDIAARGLDIKDLPHVVNYELPEVASDYVHRIGRTGRAGSFGEAISLVCIDEFGLVQDIEKLIRTKLEKIVLPGYEIDESIKPMPIRKGRKKTGFRKRGPKTAYKGKKRAPYAPGRKSGKKKLLNRT